MDERLTQETLSNLVTQFSSAWDYLRELVQNSIDAGSNHIDVWTDFQPGPPDNPDAGVIEIHVEDFGAGMTEAIIDDQLTQLFSSAKEGDLTKIGKFGIGFVSVFALQPAGVLVHTGRGGEYWEIFFHADLSFTKTRIDTPVEGTQITSFLAGDHGRYAETVSAVQRTLRKWCGHSDTEINFEDRGPNGTAGWVRMNEPFKVPGEFLCEARRGELEMVMAFSRTPVFGFYNRGLALAVGQDPDEMLGEFADRFRHIAFKVKSPWLEHTLSRETVMKDEHFAQAMSELASAAQVEMRERLVDGLCARARAVHWDLDEQGDYLRWLAYLSREPEDLLLREGFASKPILRGVHGEALCLEDAWHCYDKERYVYVCAEPSELTRVLAKSGRPVFLAVEGKSGTAVHGLLARYTTLRAERRRGLRLFRRLGMEEFLRRKSAELADPHEVMCAVEPGVGSDLLVDSMLRAARATLHKLGHKYGALRPGKIESGEGHTLFVIAPELSGVMAKPHDLLYTRGRWERPEVVVDPRHPHMRELLELAACDAQLAVMLLCQALVLHEAEPGPEPEELFAGVRRCLSREPLRGVEARV